MTEGIREVKQSEIKELKKEDIIICKNCRKAYIQTGEQEATIIMRLQCPNCQSTQMYWAIGNIIEKKQEDI